MFDRDKPQEFWHASWSPDSAGHLGVEIGTSKFQTFWEFVAAWLCLEAWGSRFKDSGLALVGDNISSLTSALKLAGKGPLGAVAREISWRKEVFRWHFAAGHVPTERNFLADSLSRLASPEPSIFPYELSGLPRWPVPDVASLWLARVG